MSNLPDSTSTTAVSNRFEDEIYDQPKADEKEKKPGIVDQVLETVRETIKPGPSPEEQRMEETMHLRR